MNRGTASCMGAITIMNAIPTGIGSALGISLRTDAEVNVSEGEPAIDVALFEEGEDDLLARECVIGVFEKAERELPHVTVRTRSSIPISRGLKSSSAAANATILATARAIDLKLDDLEVIKLGVKAAKKAGVTVTGAFDDATACYFGGIVITNNNELRIIRRDSLDRKDLMVILHVPERKIRKKGLSRKTFDPVLERFQEVWKLVENGNYFEAMTLNGQLCSRALALKEDVSERAIKAGAIAAGLTGTGPATAIICDEVLFDDVLSAVYQDDVVIIVAEINENPAPEVIPRH